jgi:hypothetical protein
MRRPERGILGAPVQYSYMESQLVRGGGGTATWWCPPSQWQKGPCTTFISDYLAHKKNTIRIIISLVYICDYYLMRYTMFNMCNVTIIKYSALFQTPVPCMGWGGGELLVELKRINYFCVIFKNIFFLT